MATAYIPIEAPFIFENFNRDSLIEDHLSLVRFLAGRVCSKLPSSIEVDDLIGAGTIGLIDAADKFDPTRGIRFRTYAERRIRGAILDHLRSLDWAPRSLRRRARELQAAHSTLQREHGRSVEDVEVAAFLEIGIDELHGLVNEINSVQLASLHLGDDADGSPVIDPIQSLPASPEFNPFTTYEREEARQQLADAVEALPEKERLVISLYYVDELTMKEIGSVLGVNESRVSQIHTKAVARLRGCMLDRAA
ncbi:MAG: FliA/WhiG family RNA polymerase sigma factor [Acidobacteria bacterium]|nr:FliA/WhiG family RNA polymerase sigma factor [Acidobacteriota bacterium]